MTTAFQSDAFQNNAFQIDVITPTSVNNDSGSGRRRGARQARKYLELVEEYKQFYRDIPTDIEKKIISAVNPFVLPETTQEIARHNSAAFLFDNAPPAERINFELLNQNSISLDRFKRALQEVRIRQEEEEIALIMLLIN